VAVALLLLLIIGAALLWQGAVGRFGWDVPRCAKCRDDGQAPPDLWSKRETIVGLFVVPSGVE
jgi:hypothetical protein